MIDLLRRLSRRRHPDPREALLEIQRLEEVALRKRERVVELLEGNLERLESFKENLLELRAGIVEK